VALADFDGRHVADFTNPAPAPRQSPEHLVQFLAETLQQAVAAAGLGTGDISGAGLGLPGFVDAPTGLVHWSPTLTERDVPLQQLLSDTLGLPVFVDNDTNLVAQAEQRFGLGQNIRNFIVVTVEQGVGMGIVIDGRIYRGNRGAGAELGHTKVQLDGALCRCGQRGCLEAYVGDYALLREAGTAIEMDYTADPDSQMQQLLQAAAAGNEMASSILRRAGRMFSMGLANVVNIFAPELIILSGASMRYDFLYADDVIRDTKKMSAQFGTPMPDIKVHNWGDRMWAVGAAAYAIEEVARLNLQEMTSNAT